MPRLPRESRASPGLHPRTWDSGASRGKDRRELGKRGEGQGLGAPRSGVRVGRPSEGSFLRHPARLDQRGAEAGVLWGIVSGTAERGPLPCAQPPGAGLLRRTAH